MTIPLAMLAVLVAPALIALALRAAGRDASVGTGGVIGLVLLFLFAASGHFIATAAMVQMLPPFVPGRVTLVHLTGLIEIALAVGIAVPATRRLAGWGAIAALIGFYPANVYAAVNSIGMGGHELGPAYLLIRTPLQALLVAWAWWFAVRSPAPAAVAATARRGN
jgi:uncharacterized membrane protein